MAQAVAAPSMFAIFRKRDFRLMWSAQLVSTIGSSLTDLAAGILVYQVTQSALNVGLVLMVTALPTLLVGLFAGVFVDRFNRKRILLASDLLRGLLVLSIPFSVHNWGLPALYVIVFLAATVRQFFDPAWESVLPEIASEEELAGANSFLSISSFGSTAVGFAAAGLLAGINIDVPFYIDALTFGVSFVLILLVKIKANASADATTVGVVIANLKEGAQTLWRIPVLRSLFLAGLPVFLSFGLWNTLLLPMAIRALDATEFEYGIQEGLTSVGFVASALLMAKLYDRIPDGQWLVSSILLMGVFGVLYGLAPNIQVAILLVTITGFLNSPSSIARRTLLQRNTPREMRGRVFSAFFVSRDVVFLIGMAGAGLADFIDVRILIVACSLILVGAGVLHQVLPGIGQPAAEWRRALQLLRTAPTAESLAAGRAATMMDLDRLIGVLPELGALAIPKRVQFLDGASVRRAAPGTAIVKVGDASDSAFFVLGGKAVAGIPSESGEYNSLSSMGPGDFFGEIAAITGSPRTANVLADEPTELLEVPAATLRALRDVPEMERVINSKLTERLTRTANADLVRLAGLDQRDLRDLRRPRSQVVAGGPTETGSDS
ncbi:MAG TPA: MFS transporter [Candidatus Polarisedimenticolia bacterium]|nr:MFS transporter [Candidatus Polarisedimenticolia bacterium]